MRRIITSTRRATLVFSHIAITGIGLRAAANNVPVTVPLPPDWSPGDLFVAPMLFSTPTGELITPTGWALISHQFNADGELRIFTKIAETGDTDPTFNINVGAAGDGILGGIVAISGVDTVDPIAALGPDTITTEPVTNIDVTAPNAGSITNGAVLFVGARNAGGAASGLLSGNGLTWQEVFDFSEGALGTYLVADFASWDGPAPTLTNKTFLLSGARVGSTYGKAVVLRPSQSLVPTTEEVPATAA